MRIRFSPIARCLAAGAVLAVASEAHGQQAPPADSLPFRKGQWAGQFTLGFDQRNIGVLRFRSSRVAWLLDGWFNFTGSRNESDYDDSRRSDAFMNLRLGRRVYHPLVAHTAGFYTVGALGGGGRSRETRRVPLPGGGSEIQTLGANSWSAGVFGELGASYLVTQHLSAGMTAGSAAVYSASRGFGQSSARGRSVQVNGNVFSLIATLYF